MRHDWKNATNPIKPNEYQDLNKNIDKPIGSARGVFKDAPMPDNFEHSRHAPSSALAGVVQHFWAVRWHVQGQPQAVKTLPHPNVHLVIERGRSGIFGIASGRFTRLLEARGCVFGVKFRPGGFRPFLAKPVSTLTNHSLPIHAVFANAESIEADVLAHDTVEAMIAVISDFLIARLPPADDNTDRVAKMVDSIEHDRSITTVEQLVAKLGINKRALQRLFNEYVGVSPKWVINRYRLHEALEQLAHGRPPDWAVLALELGYFDQAHFIRDFKALVGYAPAEYARLATR
jgi:AraC-like DNA-binding protein